MPRFSHNTCTFYGLEKTKKSEELGPSAYPHIIILISKKVLKKFELSTPLVIISKLKVCLVIFEKLKIAFEIKNLYLTCLNNF